MLPNPGQWFHSFFYFKTTRAIHILAGIASSFWTRAMLGCGERSDYLGLERLEQNIEHESMIHVKGPS